MKGLVTSDVVGIMVTIIALFVFFLQIFPNILSIIADNFSKASAENVARQLSSLITSSGSAPYEIRIDYIPSKNVDYSVIVYTRTVRITPYFKVAYARDVSNSQPFAIDLGDYQADYVNHFIIEREFVEGVSYYDFEAKKG